MDWWQRLSHEVRYSNLSAIIPFDRLDRNQEMWRKLEKDYPGKHSILLEFLPLIGSIWKLYVKYANISYCLNCTVLTHFFWFSTTTYLLKVRHHGHFGCHNVANFNTIFIISFAIIYLVIEAVLLWWRNTNSLLQQMRQHDDRFMQYCM